MATLNRCKYLFHIGVTKAYLGSLSKWGQPTLQNCIRVGLIQPSSSTIRSQSTTAPSSTVEQTNGSSMSDSDSEKQSKSQKNLSVAERREGLVKFIHSKLITSIKDDSINESDKETIVKDSIQRLLALGYFRENQSANHALENFVDRRLATMDFGMFLDLLQFYVQQTNNTRMKDILLHESVWRLNKCSISEMLKIAKLVTPDRSAKGQEVIQMCRERVRKGTKDILTAQDLVMAIRLMQSQQETAETIELLEETAFFFLTSMNSTQLCNLLYFMACNRTKNSILRKAVVREITKQKLSVHPYQLPDLFFSCSVLNIHDEKLLSEMSEKVLSAVKSKKIVKQNHFYQILDSCSKLGWCQPQLVDMLIDNLNTSVSEKRQASAVISVAKLNVSDQSSLVHSLSEGVSELRSSDPRMFLSVVHAIAALQQRNHELFHSVLKPEFYTPLLAETKGVPGFVQDLVKEKLLHIQGCLQLDDGVSDSALLPEASEWLKHLQTKQSLRRESQMLKNIGRFLRGSSLKDDSITVQQGKLDKYGNKIDFEVLHKTTESSAKDKRVLVRVLGFDEMLLGGREIVPNGFTAMSLRQLAANGETVVMIPYYWEKKQWEDKLQNIFPKSDSQQK